MRVFDLRVCLYTLLHSYNNQLTYIIIFSKSKISYLPSVTLLRVFLASSPFSLPRVSYRVLLLCLLLAPYSTRVTRALRAWCSSTHYISSPGAYHRLLYFSKSKSHHSTSHHDTSHDPTGNCIQSQHLYPPLSSFHHLLILYYSTTSLGTYNNQQKHLLLSCIHSDVTYKPFASHI